ncbi:MAG: hypothetical protein LBC68_04945 [Prevotellaceae bacterium]|jgi:hypothetical protein|nr:hypothetical protein [Prevotellaceae bacterium]
MSIENESKIKGDNYLEYLGYKFTKIRDNKDVILKISIAEKKLKKIKSRITKSFIEYTKNCDLKLLENRIKFLTGNYSIKKNNEGNDLRAGIYFNYSQITDIEQLKYLNNYYRKILFAKKGNLGLQISCLSPEQKNKLKKYCFKSGFEKKIYYAFNYLQMEEIVSCW